ncbi:phospholipid transport system substrate-binding protein [Desulfuromusa kysingii]|uniref:Phospholipid transport system substrate-binding protein n=1 Tax=Desulfuromusa kysingii TaxID=37625 RepID=A0A1H3WRT6_9BACT|nr:ABC transporter substrate-binding protein [Desulfuromusa kysingii]SDZ89853.1 phospholipid transport system substrate-binding protein [Desulfuromusa kysingii]
MKKIILFCGLLILLCSASCFALPQPQARVKQMVDTVLNVLQQPDLSATEKRAQISGQVQEYLNIASMARRTLGSYWDGASAEQQQRFSDLFVKILEGTYLSRIDDYSTGTVQYLKQRVKDDKAIIDTVIVAKELEIPVQYKMIYVDNVWQVFDLVIEGVSLVKNYRSSYGEIIRQEGYEGLLALMVEKVQAMESSM